MEHRADTESASMTYGLINYYIDGTFTAEEEDEEVIAPRKMYFKPEYQYITP